MITSNMRVPDVIHAATGSAAAALLLLAITFLCGTSTPVRALPVALTPLGGSLAISAGDVLITEGAGDTSLNLFNLFGGSLSRSITDLGVGGSGEVFARATRVKIGQQSSMQIGDLTLVADGTATDCTCEITSSAGLTFEFEAVPLQGHHPKSNVITLDLGVSLIVTASMSGGLDEQGFSGGGTAFADALFDFGDNNFENSKSCDLLIDGSEDCTSPIGAAVLPVQITAGVPNIATMAASGYVIGPTRGGLNTTGMYRAESDPLIQIDPNDPQAADYTLIFSPGVFVDGAATVPEPSTLLLLLGGLAGLVAGRSRRTALSVSR